MDRKILILGSGFGGIRTAHALARRMASLPADKRYEIILIDKSEFHTYTPLLYEVATTSKETADACELHSLVAHDIASLTAHEGITFIHDEIAKIDLAQGSVTCKERGTISGRYLVLALGSETNFFNIPGMRTHGLPLKTFADAIRIRDAVWNRAMDHQKLIRVVVGGAGSTGVELVGELQAWEGQLKKLFPGCTISATLIEAHDTVLSGFSKRLVRKATKRLERLGVMIMTGTRITHAEEGKVFLDDGSYASFDVLVWSGGVYAPHFLSNLPLRTKAAGRVEVFNEMTCIPETPDLKLLPRVYGVGDNICCVDPSTGQPNACVARAAIEQGSIAAHNIIEDIRLDEGLSTSAQHKTYIPRDYSYIVPIGGKYAIAKIGPFVICGFPGWLLKGLVELRYLVSIMNWREAASTWLRGLWIFVKNDRLG